MNNKNQYVFLDGIRGVAAMFVVTCHTGDYWKVPFQHAYLAVDLFFLMSGFVIANAYEARLKAGTLSNRTFFISRLIRLYPMFIASLVLSTLLALGRTFLGHHSDILSSTQIAHAFVLNLFFIPAHISGVDALFPLNGLYWSLFFELLINATYAVLLPFLNNKLLIGIILSSAVVVGGLSISNGSLDLGHTWQLASLLAGFSRAVFGIFLGVLIYRRHSDSLRLVSRKSVHAMPGWIAFLAIISLLSTPRLPFPAGVFDAIVVIAILPFLISRLVRSRPGKFEKVLLFLGAASYPMYVFQSPMQALIQFLGKGLVEAHSPESGFVFLIAITLFSVSLERQIDLPIRRFIAARILLKRSIDLRVVSANEQPTKPLADNNQPAT